MELLGQFKLIKDSLGAIFVPFQLFVCVEHWQNIAFYDLCCEFRSYLINRHHLFSSFPFIAAVTL